MEQNPVDFVLAYQLSKLTDESVNKIIVFVNNLKQKGFKLESDTLSINDDIRLIKISASKSLLLRYADAFSIELAFQSTYLMEPKESPHCAFMRTPLTMPITDPQILTRAPETSHSHHPRDITSAERGLIVYEVLRKNAFGPDVKMERGIDKLLHQHVFTAAYPIHDGPWEWSKKGPLNDRQLLARYWASFGSVFKEQPLDLIHKYYGPSIAFYFAWLGFYNRMLIPISIIGVILFCLGSVTFDESFRMQSKEICESDIILCPQCVVKHCKYYLLKSSCFRSKLMHLFDNPCTIVSAVLTSIWSTIFVELWRRQEAVLKIKWNLQHVEHYDMTVKPEYEARATRVRYSEITRHMEVYEPNWKKCLRLTLTWSLFVFLIYVMLLGILGVIVYRVALIVVLTRDSEDKFVSGNVDLIASVTGSIISVTFIILFEFIYNRWLAKWLTDRENPRTQQEFDNSYIYKLYIMECTNYYAAVFYIAFAKARFFTWPGDVLVWGVLEGIAADLCDPTGCAMDLAVHLIVIMLFKNLFKTLLQYVKPRIKEMLIKRSSTRKKTQNDVKEQWEKDYLKVDASRLNIMQEYMQMIIQYGFVTFFVAAFPPAPLLALINNLMELRVDAGKYTQVFRRQVAVKVAGIGAWKSILYASTYIGIATNAFVIASTSEFIPRAIYRHEVNDEMKGFIKSTLSVFNTSEYPMDFGLNISYCYYPGKRHPPNHPKRYALTNDYWYELAIKFAVVVMFEHVLLLITGLLAYTIPDIPFSVKAHINAQKAQRQALKREAITREYLEETQERTDLSVDLTDLNQP